MLKFTINKFSWIFQFITYQNISKSNGFSYFFKYLLIIIIIFVATVYWCLDFLPSIGNKNCWDILGKKPSWIQNKQKTIKRYLRWMVMNKLLDMHMTIHRWCHGWCMSGNHTTWRNGNCWWWHWEHDRRWWHWYTSMMVMMMCHSWSATRVRTRCRYGWCTVYCLWMWQTVLHVRWRRNLMLM